MADGPVALVWRQVAGPVDPEAAFLACFAGEPGAFWLDSSRPDTAAGRWSFLGAAGGPLSRRILYDAARRELTAISAAGTRRFHGDLFDYLDAELARLRCVSPELPFDFNCGFVGWFGYELKELCGADRVHAAPTPDAAFVFADRLLAIDHAAGRAFVVGLHDGSEASRRDTDSWIAATAARAAAAAAAPAARPGPLPVPPPRGVELRLRTPYGTYLADVQRCLDLIRDGESYEICLTHRIDVAVDVAAAAAADFAPIDVYRRLRRRNPAPFAAFLDIEGTQVLCASPERYLRVGRDRGVEAKPIKGTAPRGDTPARDRDLREALERSEKERAENLMIVDLLRNDLGRVCEVGSVHVPVLMGIETYESVHQMVSTVRGRLRPDATVLDCVRASFPGGSMTGAPKRRTMAILDSLEPVARGIYSGSLGYLGLNGTADLNIVIRAIVVAPEHCSIGVGGAIVALSEPEREFEETLVKARAAISAILESAGAAVGTGTYLEVGAALRADGRYRHEPQPQPRDAPGQRWQVGQ